MYGSPGPMRGGRGRMSRPMGGRGGGNYRGGECFSLLAFI